MENVIKRISKLAEKIDRPINLMEVCGTHTVAIFRHGIRSVIPDKIRLLSGPGCPVCVTSMADVEKAIALSQREEVILTTFGDMMRVPGKPSGRQTIIPNSPLTAVMENTIVTQRLLTNQFMHGLINMT